MKTMTFSIIRGFGKSFGLAAAAMAVAWTLFGAETKDSVPAKRLVVAVVDTCPEKSSSVQVPQSYFQALESAGHVPFLLPQTANPSVVGTLLGKCDLVLLAGGEDVEPKRYGEKNSPKLEAVNRGRDAFEYLVLDEAIKLRKPLFGICRGCQILNCRFGGSLVQDIPSEVGGSVVHRVNEPRGGAVHPVRAVAGSRLASILGDADFRVVSWHHQAVEKLGRGIRASAKAADGVVEAIESDDYPMAAVQFHPEKDHRDCPVGTLKAIFENLDRLTTPKSAAAEVWYIPGWNRTTETNGLAYASCTNVFSNSRCSFKGWDGDGVWWSSAEKADLQARQLADEIAALPAEVRRQLTIVGHSLGGRIVARTLARLAEKDLKIKQGIMLAPAIPAREPDVLKMGAGCEQPALLVVNPEDVVLKYIFTISGVKDPSLGADGSPKPLDNVSEYSVPDDVTRRTKVDALWGKVEWLKRMCNHLACFYFNELDKILEGKPSEKAQTRIVQGLVNVEWKVMDQGVWWVVVDSWSGWKLERNRVTGHCRILNPDKRRVAWGSESDMRESFAKLKQQL